jgi:hypothetical protein
MIKIMLFHNRQKRLIAQINDIVNKLNNETKKNVLSVSEANKVAIVFRINNKRIDVEY